MHLVPWRVLCVWSLTLAWGCSAASGSFHHEEESASNEHEQTGLFLPAAAICAAVVSALLAVLRQRRAAAKATDHHRAHCQNYQSGTILGHNRTTLGPKGHKSELLGPGHGDPVTADCLQPSSQWGDWLDSCKPFKAPAQQPHSSNVPGELHAASPVNSPLYADCLLSTGCTSCSPLGLDAPGWSGQSEVQRSVAGCAQLLDSCRVPYVSKLGACTVHIKVPFIEPEQLPVDFFEKIQAGLQARASGHLTIVGGAVRRGCVELAMDIITTRAAMMPQYQPPPDNPDGAGPPRDPEGVLVEGEAAKSASLAYSRGGNWSQGGRMGTPPRVSGSQAGPSADASGMAMVEGMNATDQGVFGDADLQGLTPLDWVHWLYLQPPAEAEVLVQACGRSFITCWDAKRQHWLTHEMSATDSQGNRLPDRLPRVVHVDPPCVALCGHETDSAPASEGLALASTSVCVSAPPTPLRLLVVGHNLHQAHSSVAARFLGVYLSVESRPLYAPGQAGQAASSSASGSRQLPAPAWLGQLEEGLQVLELLVHGVVRPGLLQLEGWCARLLAWRWQVAVVDQSAVATELSHHFGEAGLQPLLLPATLQSPLASKNDLPVSASVSTAGVPPADQLKVDDLMTDLGCWLEFSAAMDALGLKLPGSSPSALPAGSGGSSSNQLAQPADTSSQAIVPSRQLPVPVTADSGLPQLSEALMQACRSVAYQEQMVDTAVQLLGYSCGTAWPATASMLLDGLLRLGLTWQGVRNLTTQHSLTLLHRAVCSGSHSMVQLVAGWGDAHGVPWQWSEADPGSGITPLHLAAMLPAGGVGGSGSLHLDQLLLASGGSSGHVGAMAAAIDTAGSDSLADWILTEFDAACRFWHGATDAQGVTPADVLVAVNRSPAGSALVTPNAGVNTHQLGPWSEHMVQERLGGMQVHASNGSSSGEQPSNRTGGEITIDQVRNAGVMSRQEAVEGWILDSAPKVLPEEVSMGSWQRDSGTFLLDLSNGSPSRMPAGPSGPGGLTAGPRAASSSPPASRNLHTEEPAAAAIVTGLRAGVPASVAAPPSGPVTGTSKAASRLEAELQLVQAALAPKVLLRASFLQFTSRRLETAFVGWLTNKRQRLRRLLPGLMACVFATAISMELKQGTDPRGIWTFISFAVPWVALLWHGWLVSKTAISRMYDEETWVAVVLWHLLVRGLQAADVLHVPVSVRTFVYRGGDAMSEGAVQVFFLVRTQRMALLRVLYCLSAIALYLRGGLPIANASIIALSGNAACLIASWLLDLTNRRHFLQHLVAMLEQQQRQELQQRQQRLEAQAAQAAGQARVASPSSRLRNGHTANGLTSRPAARTGMQKA